VTWTHGICDRCWFEAHPGELPTRIVPEERDRERCCKCGEPTRSGIYTRADPASVPFPRKVKT